MGAGGVPVGSCRYFGGNSLTLHLLFLKQELQKTEMFFHRVPTNRKRFAGPLEHLFPELHSLPSSPSAQGEGEHHLMKPAAAERQGLEEAQKGQA